MAIVFKFAEERFLRAIKRIAKSRIDGALLSLAADRAALRGLQQAGTPGSDIVSMIGQTVGMADTQLRPEGSMTSGWGEHKFVVVGSRERLVSESIKLIQAISHHPVCGQIGWRAILVRIFPDEALRTLWCDPGYGLAPIKAPAVVWVEPYSHDDWKESQRYPTVTPMWPRP
jgi:hypothetical protein